VGVAFAGVVERIPMPKRLTSGPSRSNRIIHQGEVSCWPKQTCWPRRSMTA